MAKMTFVVNRQEMTFSERQLVNVLEEYFDGKARTVKEPPKPTEGEWFDVKPRDIDQKLFENKRKDPNQEITRRLILDAFYLMNKYPQRYGKNFRTMMPKRESSHIKSVAEFKEIAKRKGDRIANWIEQAFEWAQRIQNGELWETICNCADTANWYRLVEWKNGYVHMVGGSVNFPNNIPATFMQMEKNINDWINCCRKS